MWSRRSNFAQCIERAPVTTGARFEAEWDDCDVVIDGEPYTLYQPYGFLMSEEDRREFIGARLDAKIAQAANKKVPYACPDLDQDYSLDEHYLTASEQKVMKRALQRSTKLVDNVSSNPYHPFQTNFKGQVP